MGDGVSGHLMAKDTIDTQVFSGLVTNQSSPPSLKLSYMYVFHARRASIHSWVFLPPITWILYNQMCHSAQ